MKRFICRILTCSLALAMLLSTSILAFATDISESTNMTLISYTASGEEVHIPANATMEDGIYYDFYDSISNKQYAVFNPENGDYFRFVGEDPSTASPLTEVVDKTFEFKIHSSVTSSSFKISGSPAYLVATAKAMNEATGKEISGNSYSFSIRVAQTSSPFSSRTYTEKVSKRMSKTMSWVTSLKYYTVQVIAPEEFRGTGYYLIGNGIISHKH